MNTPLVGRLAVGLTLVVVAAAACTGPAGDSSPGDAEPAVSASPTILSEPVSAADAVMASDPEAAPEQARADVADVQDLQRIAAAAVQLDVDAFAEIKPGGPRDVDPRRYRQLIGRDRIVPIYEPLIISAADTVTTPEELVMGVILNGEARAYPVSQMRSREIANDELGGIPILVTW
jgi:hypothetical protein